MYLIARPSKFHPARPLALAVIAEASLLNASAGNAADSTVWTASAYRGSVNVVEGHDENQQVIDGVAFVLMPLMTVDDIDEIARKTPSYRAPGQ